MPSGERLVIEIQGDNLAYQLTKMVNLRTESKMERLKKCGYNVSWISEEDCRKLSRVKKDSVCVAMFWDIIKKNWVS